MSSASTSALGDRIDEERKGLLSGKESLQLESVDWPHQPWPRSKIVGIAAAFILILIGGAFTRVLLLNPQAPLRKSVKSDTLASNGTHDFKKTVLMVSIDGLR
jgi:hypothetical protein